MNAFSRLFAASVLVAGCVGLTSAASAMPVGPAPEGKSLLETVARVCDYRGCWNKYTGMPVRPPVVRPYYYQPGYYPRRRRVIVRRYRYAPYPY